MGLPPLDELVGWRTDRRGRVTALEGARARHPIGWLGRFLLPELNEGFAEPGDLLCLLKPPALGRPMTAAANLTRRTAAVVSTPRRIAIMLAVFLPGVAAELLLGASGWVVIAAAFAASAAAAPFLFHRSRALTFLGVDALSRAELYWALARHRLAPNAPRRPEPEPEPEPDWAERLASSFAGTLPDHEWVDAGILPVPDGRLVACDPFDIARAVRRPIAIPPGTYKVVVAVGRFGPPGSTLAEHRVAHAWVRIGAGPAVRWEEAEDDSGEEAWVDVDSGCAAFTSAAAVPALIEAYREGEQEWLDPRLTEELQRQMAGSPVRAGRHWATVDAGEARMIAFESGYGDGGYRILRGVGPAGELVAVAVDFRVARWIYPHG
jgi:hypothetical protein